MNIEDTRRRLRELALKISTLPTEGLTPRERDMVIRAGEFVKKAEIDDKVARMLAVTAQD